MQITGDVIAVGAAEEQELDAGGIRGRGVKVGVPESVAPLEGMRMLVVEG